MVITCTEVWGESYGNYNKKWYNVILTTDSNGYLVYVSACGLKRSHSNISLNCSHYHRTCVYLAALSQYLTTISL